MKHTSFIGKIRLAKNFILTKFFFPGQRLVRWPVYVRGRKYIKWGKQLTTGIQLRMDAMPVDSLADKVLFLGDNIQVNDFVHIAAVSKVVIGNNVLIASKVFISDHNHGFYGQDNIHSNPLIAPIKRELSYKPVIIKDNVWIGELVAILPGVTIGEGCIIGSLSVVTKDIPPYSIAVGSPARVIKVFNFEANEWQAI